MDRLRVIRNTEVNSQEELWILNLRQRRLGVRRIQSELAREYNCHLSIATIHKVLRRTQRPTPSDRVQVDVCKIAPKLYQYTAIDDCTRIKILRLYSNRSSASSLDFLEWVISKLPFPIERLQTDRGREFFAYEFQDRLREYGIKFRPIKPRSPHLNGKVERSQRTDLEEFYAGVDLESEDLHQQLEEWQDYYNHFRVHGSLNRRTPWEKWMSLASETPTWEEIEQRYDSSKERIREQNYDVDMKQRKLQPSL